MAKMSTTINTVLTQFKENPVNWALVAVLVYAIKSYVQAPKMTVNPPKHPKVLEFRNYTPKELLPFNGADPDEPILLAVNGNIFDVTKGRSFYGPDGPYANFAGRDASRGLAKHSFDEEMLTDPEQPIDTLEDLDKDEWSTLRDWEQSFKAKYLHVGKLVEPQGQQDTKLAVDGQ